MKLHWSSPLNSLFPLQPRVNLPHGSVSARHDLQLVVTPSHGSGFCSQTENDNLLKTHGFDICTSAFDAKKRDCWGKSGAKSQEYSTDRARNPVGFGVLREEDIFGHRSGCENEDSRSEMRESCAGRSDRIWPEDGTVEEAGCHIEDPRQALMHFNIICDESYLLAEAKRLREKNQGASSAVARLVAAELIRIAIAEAQVSV